MEPIEALRRIAFLLERAHEPTYRVRAFRGAAEVIAPAAGRRAAAPARHRTLSDLKGIGKVTATVIEEALGGQVPAYLSRLEASSGDAGRRRRSRDPGCPAG